MRSLGNTVGMVVGTVAVIVMAATGCTEIATGTPVADPAAATESTTAPKTRASAATTAPVPDQSAPVGSAVMSVTGGSGPVTISYRINGGPEQTETNVFLPWEKRYPVYEKLESEVTADGGDTSLICTIIMEGDMLVSFKSEPRPTCNFAYWG